MLTKAQIRNKILSRLKSQKEEERLKKSRVIQDKLLNTPYINKAKTVMFYISFDGEVDTEEMIKKVQESGKTIAVPVCGKNRLLRPAELSEGAALTGGPYGTKEPRIKKWVKIEDLEVVVVPAVAFDKEGRRLGRGKGFYDRFLKRLPSQTTTVGLAFDFQILPHLPTTSRDVKIHQLISD